MTGHYRWDPFSDFTPEGYTDDPGSGVGGGPEGMTNERLRHHLCPACSGIGLEFYNEARDPFTGTWERDERYCGACNGTGMLVATA